MARRGSFTTDIASFVAKTGISGSQVMRKLGFLALSGVIVRSPVDTGRFRASNRMGINRPNLSVVPPREGQSVAAGEATGPELQSALTKIASVRWGDSIHITNNLPYAISLERGHSGQAPRGIYGLTFQELIANFNATVASVKQANAGK